MCQTLEQTVSLGLRRDKPTRLSADVRSVVFRLLVVAVLLLASNTSFGQDTAPPPDPACVPYKADYPCAYAGSGSDFNVVSVINESTKTALPGTLNLNGPHGGVAITLDNKFAYVAHPSNPSSIAVIDTASGTKANDIGLTGSATQIAITPDGTFLWAVESTQIERLDISSEETPVVSDKIPLSLSSTAVEFNSATAVAFTPDGKSAYVVGICNKTTTCVGRIDTEPPFQSDSAIQIPNSMTLLSSNSGPGPSVIVTPDGKFVCISTSINSGGNFPQEFAVAFLEVGNTANPIKTVAKTGVNGNPSRYGLGITPSGTLYAAAPFFGSSSSPLNTIFLFDPASQKYIPGTITVGNAPTGIAISADGSTVYVTNSNDGTVSAVINTQFGTLVQTITGVTSPLAIAAMPSIPPAITTQPANQQINYGDMATSMVQATGTAPLSYQWYQGVSGDTTNPVPGATGPSFTSAALTATTSYWVRVTNIVSNQDSTTLTVTVSPPKAPTITSQPATPAIATGGTATLTVQASGTPPPSYQWYQGTSGDTSKLQQGATGPSFTTPPLSANTNYWVQVTNIAGSVNSTTATVSVSPGPQCMLQFQGVGLPGQAIATATATCTDSTTPVPLALTTTLVWGDQTPAVTVSGGSLTATHTYLSVNNYVVTVTSTNTLSLKGNTNAYLNLTPLMMNPPLAVFQGQSASFVAPVSSPGPFQVNFECDVVVGSSGVVSKASDLGISCSAVSQPITFSDKPIQVTIVIQTTGGALAKLFPGDAHKGMLYSCLLPVSAVIVMLGGASSSRRGRKSRRFLTLISILLLLGPIVSCGGGFKAQSAVKTGTPAGSYQISVVDVPASNSPNQAGFAQTTLIVPLQVTPFQ